MDQKLLFLINQQWTGPVLDRFMALVSSFAAWMPVAIAAILLTLWKGGFRARVFVVTLGLIVGICDGLLAKNLKTLVQRPRPNQTMSGVRMVDLEKARPRMLAVAQPARVKLSREPKPGPVTGRSFPSSHTMNTISAALITACFFGRWGALAFIPALLVGYSRIYTGSHWPSDVAGSIVLGLLFTFAMLWALQKLWLTHGPAKFPQAFASHPRLFLP